MIRPERQASEPQQVSRLQIRAPLPDAPGIPSGMHLFTAEGANAGEGGGELAALAAVLNLLVKKWPD
jgi:hypothetical protein